MPSHVTAHLTLLHHQSDTSATSPAAQPGKVSLRRSASTAACLTPISRGSHPQDSNGNSATFGTDKTPSAVFSVLLLSKAPATHVLPGMQCSTLQSTAGQFSFSFLSPYYLIPPHFFLVSQRFLFLIRRIRVEFASEHSSGGGRLPRDAAATHHHSPPAAGHRHPPRDAHRGDTRSYRGILPPTSLLFFSSQASCVCAATCCVACTCAADPQCF